MVDKFLRNKITAAPNQAENSIEDQKLKSEDQKPNSDSPVKTIIHELKSEGAANGAKPKTVDFVSEIDVKKAVADGVKIYVTAQTIITPSARDLGAESEIFAKI